jgi:hypothetical protein
VIEDAELDAIKIESTGAHEVDPSALEGFASMRAGTPALPPAVLARPRARSHTGPRALGFGAVRGPPKPIAEAVVGCGKQSASDGKFEAGAGRKITTFQICERGGRPMLELSETLEGNH